MVIEGGALTPEIASPLVLCSLASMVTMITVLTMCTQCCVKKPKNREDTDDLAYGVIPAVTDSEMQKVQFRARSGSRQGERKSVPDCKNSVVAGLPTRASAPLAGGTRRALPQLPENQNYAIINKTPKDFCYVDEPAPTYESIDPENDSIVDPLYCKVENRPSRKYDYPVFSKTDRMNPTERDDAFYQSASVIYATGSEDPYSSIASEPRVALASVEDDDSAYDPGYAKLKPGSKVDKERTERELDQLYSKIRRGVSRRDVDSPQPGPSSVELVAPVGEVPKDMTYNSQLTEAETASTNPSYRYFTMRESAEVVRERLRQQGQLGPRREPHYYSTIGNDYESVEDNGSTTYQQVPSVVHRPTTMAPSQNVVGVSNALSINVASGEYVPPPPTSPIPERTPDQLQPEHRKLANSQGISLPGATYAIVSKPRHTATPSGPSPTIPTVVKPPTRSRAPSESEIVHTNRHSDSSAVRSLVTEHPLLDSELALAGIHEFMSRPLLPYGMADTIVNRRVTEERETIIEKRQSTGVTLDSIAGSNNRDSHPSVFNNNNNKQNVSLDRVYHVEIKRIGELQKTNELPSLNRENLQPLIFDPLASQPGPSSPISPYIGTSLKENADETPLSDRGRSGLPVPKNNAEVRRLAEKCRKRRQESIEREEREKEQESKRTLNRERRNQEKREESKRREMLGTIYTASDYVSPIGMGTERGWPLVGSSSPPSLRKSISEEEKSSHKDKMQKVRDIPKPLSFVQP